MAERGARQEAEELMGKLSALSTAMEGRDSEKELLQHDLKKAQAANRVLRGFLLLAGQRRVSQSSDSEAMATVLKELDDVNGKVKVAELALGQAAGERQSLLEMVKEREAERDSLGAANERLQARISELEAPTRRRSSSRRTTRRR